MSADFVRTEGTRFVLDGRPFRLAGVNCYWLGYQADAETEAILDAVQSAGLTTIRAWAFRDSPTPPAQRDAYQYWEGGHPVINEGPNGLGLLDQLIAGAGKRGLKLILPLVNGRADFGGMPAYLGGRALDPSQIEEFYRNPLVRDDYLAWIERVVTRFNPLTGMRYSDDRAILAWELANEPRCAAGCEVLLDWIRFIAKRVKQLDPDHLLAVGDEGFFRWADSGNWLQDGSQGVDFEAILATPEIDFGTFHFYSSNWKVGPGSARRWISDHVAAGAKAGKPVVLEEFGYPIRREDGSRDPETANRWYADWLEHAESEGCAGALVWMLTSERTGWQDQYSIHRLDEVPSLLAFGKIGRPEDRFS